MKTTFPAKILLFGEYAVMRGSDALITPYHAFSGRLESSGASHPSIRDLCDFCEEENFEWIDFAKRESDINNNLLNYTSSIPISYGIGSSGALVASIYDRYRTTNTTDIETIRTQLSQMESRFHGQSSGMDPLTSYIQKPLHKTTDTIHTHEDIDLPDFQLIDTKQIGSTKENVERFQEKTQDKAFMKEFDEHFVTQTNTAIQSILEGQHDTFWKSLKCLSQWTLEHMTRLIPESQRTHRQAGLDTDQYYCKLCGSGGGGFILQYNHNG